MRRRSKVGFLLAMVCVCGMAQKPAVPVERVEPEALETWPKVGFDVTAMDRDDNPASLSLSMITLTDDGKIPFDAEIHASGSEPQSVCVVVDTSGSTYTALSLIRAEILELARELPPQDEVCGIDFSTQAYMDMPLTADHGAFLKWTDFLRAQGGSALRDALRAAAMELEHHARYRSRAIIAISDGGENASKSSEQELKAALHALGGPVLYTLENARSSGTHSGRERDNLLRWTLDTGGMEFPVHDERALQPSIDRLTRVLAGRYRVVYTAPDPATDHSEHVLDVQLKKDLRKQKMNLQATVRYDAP